MFENQDSWRLLLLCLRAASLKTQPRHQHCQDGSLHDLRHPLHQTVDRGGGGHEDRRAHRECVVWSDWSEEVAV